LYKKKLFFALNNLPKKEKIISTMGRFEPLNPRSLVGRLIHYSMAAGLKKEQNSANINM
jgi:hypothetical protein